jgi:cell division protein FtsN
VKIEVVETAAGQRTPANADASLKLVAGKPESQPSSQLRPAQHSSDPEPATQQKASALSPVPVKMPSELYAMDIQMSRKEGFGVQVSTLYDAANVFPMVKKLQESWPKQVLVSIETDEDYHKSTYRVILGPFLDSKTAAVQQKAAAKKGYKGCFVVNLEGM